jgi:hypothetical protein
MFVYEAGTRGTLVVIAESADEAVLRIQVESNLPSWYISKDLLREYSLAEKICIRVGGE